MPSDSTSPDTARRPTSIWLKVLAIGCGGVLIVLLVVVALIAANWPKLTGYYHQAKSTVSGLSDVQSALQRKYDGQQRVMARRDNRVKGSVLAITLTNASVMNGINLDSQDGRQAALDVAAAARDALPPDGRYDNYEVIFERKGAGESGGTVSGSWEFRFTAAQLSAERR